MNTSLPIGGDEIELPLLSDVICGDCNVHGWISDGNGELSTKSGQEDAVVAALEGPQRWRKLRVQSAKDLRNPFLKLPDLEQSKTAVLNSLTSTCSQRTYEHTIPEFIDWYCSEPRLSFNKTVVTRYRIALEQRQYASATINLRLAAVRRLAYEAAGCGLLSADLAAGIRRVKGARRLGIRIGNWLTAEEGKRLIDAFDSSNPQHLEIRLWPRS